LRGRRRREKKHGKQCPNKPLAFPCSDDHFRLSPIAVICSNPGFGA
jgi:hypothetical protein